MYLRVMKMITLVRHWSQWIVLNPDYNFSDHFITSNAYTCVELIAHSLLTLVISIQTTLQPDSKSFLPWLLGSYAVRRYFEQLGVWVVCFLPSLTLTCCRYFIVYMSKLFWNLNLINNNQISTCWKPQEKDGHSCTNIHEIHSISLDDVSKSIEQACEKAKNSVTELGMSELLKQVDILISKNQELQIIYFKQHVCETSWTIMDKKHDKIHETFNSMKIKQ